MARPCFPLAIAASIIAGPAVAEAGRGLVTVSLVVRPSCAVRTAAPAAPRVTGECFAAGSHRSPGNRGESPTPYVLRTIPTSQGSVMHIEF